MDAAAQDLALESGFAMQGDETRRDRAFRGP